MDFLKINKLSDKITNFNMDENNHENNHKNKLDQLKQLRHIVSEYSNEWTKIYQPSVFGFECVVSYMINNNLQVFTVTDPKKNIYDINYNTYQAEWMYNEFIKKDYYYIEICISNNEIKNKEMLGILKKYNININDVNIIIKKDEYRKVYSYTLHI